LIVLNVSAGLLFSPLTSANRVRVVGARPADYSQISAEIQQFRRQPCLVADRQTLEWKVGLISDIRSVDYALNLFGRGLMKIEYRVPVAEVQGSTGHYLDAEGNLFPSQSIVEGLPVVALPEASKVPSASIVAGWDGERLAKLARNLPIAIPQVRWRIELDDRSVIFLTGNDLPKIVLGRPDDLEKKIDRLASILRDQPGLAKSAKEINLTAPDMPVAK